MSSVITDTELEGVLARAETVARSMAGASLIDRAGWLTAVADDLDANRDALVALATAETRLPQARLTGELSRTTFQLRLVAQAVTEGSWLEVIIDHADPGWPMGARPDIRRMLRPLGPVLVVAASNFPFAFSVAGGDTATALGAGCPVVLKAHPGHPELSRRTAAVLTSALARAGAPPGAFGLIEDEDKTRMALADHRIKAGAFTGSVRGGRALFDLAARRPDPIPFYGELGSTNPAFILPSALDQDRTAVLEGFVGSFSLGTGQFCTKPGLLFVPSQASVLDELAGLVRAVPATPMLNERIADTYYGRLDAMRKQWTLLVDGRSTSEATTPTLFTTTIEQALTDPEALFEESFGPTAVIVEYDDEAQLLDLVAVLPGQLTVTVQAGDINTPAESLLTALAERAGRLVWNGWPTGVSVTWAMQHGGSWPATTASVHTSVGPSALRRFLTPVAYQDVPPVLLPEPLREDNPWSVPRRVDGRLEPPPSATDDDAR